MKLRMDRDSTSQAMLLLLQVDGSSANACSQKEHFTFHIVEENNKGVTTNHEEIDKFHTLIQGVANIILCIYPFLF